MWHEQSREDRDDYITILWDNIQPQYIHNFSQHIADGDDVGQYDYCSIMHYPAEAFSRNPGQPTIVVRQPDRQCGNYNGILEGADYVSITKDTLIESLSSLISAYLSLKLKQIDWSKVAPAGYYI